MIRPPIFVLSSPLAVLLLTTSALLAAEPRLRIASVSTRLDGPACHWRIVALVEGDTSRFPQLTPEAQVQGANLIHQSARPPLVFLDVAAESPGVSPQLTIRISEVPSCSLDTVLPLSLSLADLPWQACWLGKESKLEGIGAAPEQGGSWKPIRLPKEWQELGVTWVRTRVVVPEAWQELGLRLNLGAVDDRDITFFNGRQIGRTDGWDKPRSYAIPRDTVAWGRENEIAVAVDNGLAGGGLYRGPLELVAGESLSARSSFADRTTQDEARRATPGPVGPRLPLRPMVVRDGVLRYQDGGEVALWGVNYYPQSWEQYQSLKKLNIDHRQSIDEDFDDFQAMGLDVIRIHVFDTEITDAAGNLVRNDHLDLLDYLVAQCNRRGIYLMLTPIAWWGSPAARPDSFSRNTPKQALSMWPAAWQIQCNYLRQFLSHTNPHTGRRLVDEPCLALLEIINEPEYWPYGNIISGDPGQTWLSDEAARRGVRAVAEEWRQFLPSPEWDSAETFACFRYQMLRRYIDTMVETIRQTGRRAANRIFRQPLGRRRRCVPGDRRQPLRCDHARSVPGRVAPRPAERQSESAGHDRQCRLGGPLRCEGPAGLRVRRLRHPRSGEPVSGDGPSLAERWGPGGLSVSVRRPGSGPAELGLAAALPEPLARPRQDGQLPDRRRGLPAAAARSNLPHAGGRAGFFAGRRQLPTQRRPPRVRRLLHASPANRLATTPAAGTATADSVGGKLPVLRLGRHRCRGSANRGRNGHAADLPRRRPRQRGPARHRGAAAHSAGMPGARFSGFIYRVGQRPRSSGRRARPGTICPVARDSSLRRLAFTDWSTRLRREPP